YKCRDPESGVHCVIVAQFQCCTSSDYFVGAPFSKLKARGGITSFATDRWLVKCLGRLFLIWVKYNVINQNTRDTHLLCGDRLTFTYAFNLCNDNPTCVMRSEGLIQSTTISTLMLH